MAPREARAARVARRRHASAGAAEERERRRRRGRWGRRRSWRRRRAWVAYFSERWYGHFFDPFMAIFAVSVSPPPPGSSQPHFVYARGWWRGSRGRPFDCELREGTSDGGRGWSPLRMRPAGDLTLVRRRASRTKLAGRTEAADVMRQKARGTAGLFGPVWELHEHGMSHTRLRGSGGVVGNNTRRSREEHACARGTTRHAMQCNAALLSWRCS